MWIFEECYSQHVGVAIVKEIDTHKLSVGACFCFLFMLLVSRTERRREDLKRQ